MGEERKAFQLASVQQQVQDLIEIFSQILMKYFQDAGAARQRHAGHHQSPDRRYR